MANKTPKTCAEYKSTRQKLKYKRRAGLTPRRFKERREIEATLVAITQTEERSAVDDCLELLALLKETS